MRTNKQAQRMIRRLGGPQSLSVILKQLLAYLGMHRHQRRQAKLEPPPELNGYAQQYLLQRYNDIDEA